MEEKKPSTTKQLSADWLFKGILSRLGETFDQFSGRAPNETSSLATSGLIDRLKALLDQEKIVVEGKGVVVPHRIKLKMQWDKFAPDTDTSLGSLSESLAVAAIDHINDSLYYTYAPVTVEINTDYFTEGVKLTAGFDDMGSSSAEAEHDVTMPNIVIPESVIAEIDTGTKLKLLAIIRFDGKESRRELDLEPGRSISVGRTGSNDLVIDDPSISKIHASLVSDANGLVSVADTGSTNGTLVNGERIPYGKAIPIPGDAVVTFGTVEVQFKRITPSSHEEERPMKGPGDLNSDEGLGPDASE